MNSVKKIVVIGPESTGKSTLTQALAQHYHTVWCPEYAREHLTQHGMNYNYADLLTIAQRQLQQEDALLPQAKNGVYFIDTCMQVMKVWCEVVFEQCHPWILKQIAERRYDLYLLCNTDLPWVADGLREYPDLAMRERLFNMYLDLMVQGNTPWALISGTNGERLNAAITAVENVQM